MAILSYVGQPMGFSQAGALISQPLVSTWTPCQTSSTYLEGGIGLITAAEYNLKSRDKSDMSKYRGIIVGNLIAVCDDIRAEMASWAEEHAVKAKGQAGFRKDYRTTNNVFVLR